MNFIIAGNLRTRQGTRRIVFYSPGEIIIFNGVAICTVMLASVIFAQFLGNISKIFYVIIL